MKNIGAIPTSVPARNYAKVSSLDRLDIEEAVIAGISKFPCMRCGAESHSGEQCERVNFKKDKTANKYYFDLSAPRRHYADHCIEAYQKYPNGYKSTQPEITSVQHATQPPNQSTDTQIGQTKQSGKILKHQDDSESKPDDMGEDNSSAKELHLQSKLPYTSIGDSFSASTDPGEHGTSSPKVSNTSNSVTKQKKESKADWHEIQSRTEEKEVDYPPRMVNRSCSHWVLTNHFRLSINPKALFFEYTILGVPARMNRDSTKKLLEIIIDTIPFLNRNKGQIATDNLTTIVAWKDLHTQSSEQSQIEDDGKEYYGPYHVKNPDGDPLSIKIRPQKLDIQRLLEYATGTNKDLKLWNPNSVIKALNMIISKCVDSTKTFQAGANKFFIADSKTMDEGPSLNLVNGFFYTAKASSGGILLNTNSTTSAIYRSQLISEFLKDEQTFRDEYRRREALKGLRVVITYGRGRSEALRKVDMANSKGREKRIEHADGTSISDMTFDLQDMQGNTKTITVKAYLEETYGHIFDKSQSVLSAVNLGNISKKSWHSGTHLRILPNQMYTRPVPDHLTETMLNEACQTPSKNREALENELWNYLRTIEIKDDEWEFDTCPEICITRNLLKASAANLAYPEICYGNARKVTIDPSKNSRWSIWKQKFLDNGTMAGTKMKGTFIILIHAYGFKFGQTLNQYKSEIKAACRNHNIADATDEGHTMISEEVLKNFEGQNMRNALNRAKNADSQGRRKLAILLLPKRKVPIYQKFKDMADREFGLHSICITENSNVKTSYNKSTRKQVSFMGTLAPYFANVAMKMNLKFGGINHTTMQVKDLMSATLVLGADVTHPGPGAIEGCPSIAAIVGSVDEYGGKFLGSMRIQGQPKTDREIIQEVRSMVVERLQDWSRNHNGELPKNILYYRDGVSEGQYAKVKLFELAAIRAAYADVAKEKRLTTTVQITAIVCGKRHHTRFYPIANGQPQQTRNCQPGTLVDTEVTSPYFTDFFLISHHAIQGTARPTHYFVLEDDMQLGSIKIQDITHAICYTYVRATVGVSYASPAYYADRLCERGRCYIRDFLTGEVEMRNKLNAYKRGKADIMSKARRAMFPRKLSSDGSRAEKSLEEMEKEHSDRRELSGLCRDFTVGEVKAVWNRHDGSDTQRMNPWSHELDATMFWM